MTIYIYIYIYIGRTTTTLSRRFIYHLSDTSDIKQHLITKHNNDNEKLISSDIQNILNYNTRILCKNNNKNRPQIFKVICIKKN